MRIREKVIGALNTSLKRTEDASAGFGFRLHFLKGNFDLTVLGPFTENGLIRILETGDFECVDQVASFLDATCDELCGYGEVIKVTQV